MAATRDTIARYVDLLPKWLRLVVSPWSQRLNWPEENRAIPEDARVHDSVRQRYELDAAPSCVAPETYRPDALRRHNEFKNYYRSYPPA